jgi:hypothetical protein
MSRFMAALAKNQTQFKAPPPKAVTPDVKKDTDALDRMRADMSRLDKEETTFRQTCEDDGNVTWREGYLDQKTNQFVHGHWVGFGSIHLNHIWKKMMTRRSELAEKIEVLEKKLGLSMGSERVFRGQSVAMASNKLAWSRMSSDQAKQYYAKELDVEIKWAHQNAMRYSQGYKKVHDDLLEQKKDAKITQALADGKMVLLRKFVQRQSTPGVLVIDSAAENTLIECVHVSLEGSYRRFTLCDCKRSACGTVPTEDRIKHPKIMIIGPVDNSTVNSIECFKTAAGMNYDFAKLPLYQVNDTLTIGRTATKVRIIGVKHHPHDYRNIWQYIVAVLGNTTFLEVAESDLTLLSS